MKKFKTNARDTWTKTLVNKSIKKKRRKTPRCSAILSTNLKTSSWEAKAVAVENFRLHSLRPISHRNSSFAFMLFLFYRILVKCFVFVQPSKVLLWFCFSNWISLLPQVNRYVSRHFVVNFCVLISWKILKEISTKCREEIETRKRNKNSRMQLNESSGKMWRSRFVVRCRPYNYRQQQQQQQTKHENQFDWCFSILPFQ